MQIKMVPGDFISLTLHELLRVKGSPMASTLEKGGGGGDQVR